MEVCSETHGMIDTSRKLNIEISPWRMLGVIAAGVAMTALSAALAFRLLPVDTSRQLVGYAGLLLFGVGTGLALWRLIRRRGPIMTIAPEGIRDTRLAAELIPWRAVRGISTWSYKRQR